MSLIISVPIYSGVTEVIILIDPVGLVGEMPSLTPKVSYLDVKTTIR